MYNTKNNQKEQDSQTYSQKPAARTEKVYAHVKLQPFDMYHTNLKIGNGKFIYADVYEIKKGLKREKSQSLSNY